MTLASSVYAGQFWQSSFTNFGRVPLQVVLEEEEIRKQETINCDVFFLFDKIFRSTNVHKLYSIPFWLVPL